MKYIGEKVAYIKGLAEGMKLDTASDEGKILNQVLGALGDTTDALDSLTEAHDELPSHVAMTHDDMTDLEDYLVDEDEAYVSDDDDDDDDDEDLYEVICPNCGAEYLTDFESFEEDDVICPECGEKFVLEERVVDQLNHAEECQCGDKHDK